MRTKADARSFTLMPVENGIIVRMYGPEADGMMWRDVAWVFTDMDKLNKFLFEQYVDVPATLKEMAEDSPSAEV